MAILAFFLLLPTTLTYIAYPCRVLFSVFCAPPATCLASQPVTVKFALTKRVEVIKWPAECREAKEVHASISA